MQNDYSYRADSAQLPAHRPSMQAVDSSQIESIGYDAINQILYIAFKNTNSTYAYLEFPLAKWAEFVAAESKGKFMNAEIRNKFKYKKV
jgi:hypothetical protein